LEYERDKAAGKCIEAPCGIQSGSPWLPFASLFFRNWLDRAASLRDAAGTGAGACDWLFETPAGKNPSTRAATFMLQARPGRHLLADALAQVAFADFRSTQARMHPNDMFSVVRIELEECDFAMAENVATSLLRVAGARRVIFRLPDGSGGVLRPAQDHCLGWAA
jgi:hypothetical protein